MEEDLRHTANRLTGVTQNGQTVNYSYRCNGLSIGYGSGCESDRVSQTVDGVTTHYVLDQAAGLTQVLSDGTYTYLYGNGRIGQFTAVSAATDSAYFLTDALGSVRQLANSAGVVTLNESYDPYGERLSSVGSGASIYGFDGEQFDPATGLTYLRARYYASGRFLTRDAWPGDDRTPMSYNAWLFGYSNPIKYTDPSGLCGRATTPGELAECKLYLSYGISIDYSFQDAEMELILETVEDFANLLGGVARFRRNVNVSLTNINEDWATHFKDPNDWSYANYNRNTFTITLDPAWYLPVLATAPDGKNYITCQPDYEELLKLPKGSLPGQKIQAKFVLAHEMGHAFSTGNEFILASFTENVDLPLANRASSHPNPLISRNANRQGFQSEVLSDVVASKLYSPGLLNDDMEEWINNGMPGVLR